MKKKLPIIIGICIFIYAVIFGIIIAGTILLPAYVYENEKLIASELNAVNKLKYYQTVHDGITTISCSKMTGMETVWKYSASEDVTIQMYYTLQVTDGKAKLIFVPPGDASVLLTEQDSAAPKSTVSDAAPATEQQCTLDLKKGRNKIKIVCEKGTSFELSFHAASL